MEYYEQKCLTAFGNEIRKIVKVDMITEGNLEGNIYMFVLWLTLMNHLFHSLIWRMKISKLNMNECTYFNCEVYGHMLKVAWIRRCIRYHLTSIAKLLVLQKTWFWKYNLSHVILRSLNFQRIHCWSMVHVWLFKELDMQEKEILVII